MQTIDNVDNHGNNDDKDYPELPKAVIREAKGKTKIKFGTRNGSEIKSGTLTKLRYKVTHKKGGIEGRLGGSVS